MVLTLDKLGFESQLHHYSPCDLRQIASLVFNLSIYKMGNWGGKDNMNPTGQLEVFSEVMNLKPRGQCLAHIKYLGNISYNNYSYYLNLHCIFSASPLSLLPHVSCLPKLIGYLTFPKKCLVSLCHLHVFATVLPTTWNAYLFPFCSYPLGSAWTYLSPFPRPTLPATPFRESF